MAMFMAVLRVSYDDPEQSWQLKLHRGALEAMTCGALSYSAGSVMLSMELGQGWFIGVSSMIGFTGSQAVRVLACRLINRQVDKS